MNTEQPTKTCSMCGQQLTPFIHGYTLDSNYNTVPRYATGHHCPAQAKKYDDRIKEINSSAMSADQKANATMAAGYMNSWGS